MKLIYSKTYRPFLHCFNLGLLPEEEGILHSRAGVPYAKTKELIENIGWKELHLVPVNFLPPKILSQISNIPNFRLFCSYLLFTKETIYFAEKNAYTLPRSKEEDESRFYPYPLRGFCIPIPERGIKAKDAFSFGEEELHSFLGKNFMQTTGRGIVLSLPLPQDYQYNLRALLNILRSKTPSFSSPTQRIFSPVA